MTRDQNQHSTNPGSRAGTSEAERQEKIAQLHLRRSKLSTEKAALLRESFRDIIGEHYEQVWNYLRRRVPSHDDAEELCLDVHFELYDDIRD